MSCASVRASAPRRPFVVLGLFPILTKQTLTMARCEVFRSCVAFTLLFSCCGIVNVQGFSSRVALLTGGFRRSSPQRALGRRWLLAASEDKGSEVNDGLDENEAGKNEIDSSPPKYNGDASAREFFGNKFFYGDRQELADFCRLYRDKYFAEYGIETVDDVMEKLKREKDLVELGKCIAVSISKWVNFFQSRRTLEQVLHEAEIVALNAPFEISTIDDRYVPFDTSVDLIEGALLKAEDRDAPAIMIYGSSGSGKTFYAVKEAATYRTAGLHGSNLMTTVYLQVSNCTFLGNPDERAEAPSKLAKLVRDLLEQTYGPFDRLKMHVSIVLDEAGSGRLKDYFESSTCIDNTVIALQSMAESVRLVVSGTGLSGADLSSKEYAKCRMSQWSVDKVLSTLIAKFNFAVADAKMVVAAMTRHPTLKALLTNGRTAYLLLTTLSQIVDLTRTSGPGSLLVSWLRWLNERTPALIAGVVAEYAKVNGLKNLSDISRTRVAAWVFWVLEKTSTNDERLIQPPDFSALIRKEAAAALGLIEQNFEDVGDGFVFVDGDRRRSITVTPAVAVVLFLLSGVESEVLSGFEAQEQTTALYAYRQQLLFLMEAFWRRRAECKDSLRSVMTAEEDLVRSLKKLSIVQVTKSIPEKRSSSTFTFPRLSDITVWINGPQSPFADVISRYTLYQAKNCDSDKDEVAVKYMDELKKCGLLRNQTTADRGRIILLALSAAWAGLFNGDRQGVIQPKSKNFEVRENDRLRSSAYPENLLNLPSIRDDSQYVQIKEVKGTWKILDGAESWDLPLEVPDVSYVLSTNAGSIELGQIGNLKLTITERNLHERPETLSEDELRVWRENKEGRIDEDTLSESESAAWKQFLNETVVPNVSLKFLFTY
jgi:hypothetical protein